MQSNISTQLILGLYVLKLGLCEKFVLTSLFIVLPTDVYVDLCASSHARLLTPEVADRGLVAATHCGKMSDKEVQMVCLAGPTCNTDQWNSQW